MTGWLRGLKRRLLGPSRLADSERRQLQDWVQELTKLTATSGPPPRIYFVSHDLDEPPHVHVDRDDRWAKFWLAPVALAAWQLVPREAVAYLPIRHR